MPAGSQESLWEDYTVNINKERSEKTNGIFSELCQMFPQTQAVSKAAQVLGITRKQLPVEFKGFRVFVMLPETICLYLYRKLDLIPKPLLRKKNFFFLI